jgi:hypothetical protein
MLVFKRASRLHERFTIHVRAAAHAVSDCAALVGEKIPDAGSSRSDGVGGEIYFSLILDSILQKKPCAAWIHSSSFLS